jgi:hypothetical protein
LADWDGGTRRDLVLANLLGLGIVLAALLAGWREAAAFGLAVIAILDLLILLRGRAARADVDRESLYSEGEPMTEGWPEITYEQALAAYEAGEKRYFGGRTFLVRRALREEEEGLVLWVTDERTLGDHGLLLYPDGRVEAK